MPPRPITKMTVQQLRDFAKELHAQAAMIETALDEASRYSIATLDVRNVSTCADGVDSIAKFAGSIVHALTKRRLENALALPEITDTDQIINSISGASQTAERVAAGQAEAERIIAEQRAAERKANYRKDKKP
jgi:predicted transcriptional regulator